MKYVQSILLTIIVVVTSSNLVFSQSSNNTEENVSIQTSIIKVKGVTCAKDLSMISTQIEKLQGIISCEVLKKGATSKFKVQFNPSLVKESDIHLAIESTGSCEDPNERPYKVKKSN